MADREKVIKGLECCILRDPDDHARCSQCPYESNCVNRLKMDALELLKEQKAVEPKLVGVNTWTCGKCGALLGWEEFSQSGLELVKYKFCPECGQAVKWDE